MKLPALAFSTIVVLGCAAPLGDARDTEATGTAADPLSAFDWSAPAATGRGSNLGATVATVGDTVYMVHAGACATCADRNELYWSRLASNNTWTASKKIPNRSTSEKVSLAAFNGFLYMIHVTPSADSRRLDVWMSRFDPAPETWTPPSMLSYKSRRGAPGVAALDGRLYVIGTGSGPLTTDFNYQMWFASMDVSEAFTPPRTIASRWAASAPAAATLGGRLHVAYMRGTQDELGQIAHSSFDGTSWSPELPVLGGFGGGPQTLQPSLAAFGGRLHMLHPEWSPTGSPVVWWSYFENGSWSPIVSLPAQDSFSLPGLAATSTQLVTVHNAATRTATNDLVFSSFRWRRVVPGVVDLGPLLMSP